MSQPDQTPSHRLALGIEYDGTQYFGWQRQQNVPSIQAALESALSHVANHPIEVFCAGRTDKGVHALEQVVHFDSSVDRSQKAWLMGANSQLPDDIRVLWVQPVDASFHARFSAQARQYRYHIYNHPVKSAIRRHQAVWHYRPLDADRMHQSAQYLLGEHDFNAYRAAECQAKHAVRELQAISVQRVGRDIELIVKANGFLHHMVRNIVGVLLEVGEGVRPVDWSRTVLESRDRTQAGITAKPHGLYLDRIEYPENTGLLNALKHHP